MSSDNFDFECEDGTIFPNLSASTYSGMPLTKKYLEFRGHRQGPASEYTEYGTQHEEFCPDGDLVDELVDELVALRARVENFGRVASFFAGAGFEGGPSIADVIDRSLKSWENKKAVPIEWVTILWCISHWETDHQQLHEANRALVEAIANWWGDGSNGDPEGHADWCEHHEDDEGTEVEACICGRTTLDKLEVADG